jgi:glycosyltransferase involved in cell wall biosynthesis
MPVYNVEKYIVKSIQSVLIQSFEDFELLVIIDGSPDNSKRLAESFNDERIIIYEKTNGGLSDARNFGLEKARGEYIYFLDGDDWIEPNLLQISVQEIEQNNADFIIFGYYLDNEDSTGNLVATKQVFSKNIIFSKELNNLEIDENKLNILGYAWNKLYSTKFLKEHEIIFEKGTSLVEDILFNSKVYTHASKIIFIESLLYHYINRPAVSLIKTFHKNSFELNLKKSEALLSFLNSWKVDQKQRNKILAQIIVTGIRYCVNNLFAFKNDLKGVDKISYIKMMLYHNETQKYINHYEAISIIDKAYKIIISNKAFLYLYLLCKIKK